MTDSETREEKKGIFTKDMLPKEEQDFVEYTRLELKDLLEEKGIHSIEEIDAGKFTDEERERIEGLSKDISYVLTRGEIPRESSWHWVQGMSLVLKKVKILQEQFLKVGIDNDWKEFDEATSFIVSRGRKVLPVLKRELLDRSTDLFVDPFVFSRFASFFAERQDLDLIMESLNNPSIIANEDGSSAGTIGECLTRLVFEMRTKNPNDQELNKIAKELRGLIEGNKIKNKSAKWDILRALALTGAKEAEECVRRRTSNIEDYLKYWKDPDSLPDIYRKRGYPIKTRSRLI